MKKGLSIALLVVGVLLLGALIANLLNGGIWIIEGLNGKDGSDGLDGLDGQNGENGENGKSAYELALEDGFEGSLHEWLLSLAVRGQDGTDGQNGQNGNDGKDGVGVKDVKVNDAGYLIVTLTDGTVLNAGQIEGAFSGEADEMGFYEVYELVEMNGGPNNYSTLTLRDYPATGNAVAYVDKGETVLRIGEQKDDGDGYSRFLVNDTVCYAKSNCFELKYDYSATIPSYNLPHRLVLIKGEKTWIQTDQIMPNMPSNTRIVYQYSDREANCYYVTDGFSVTPATVGEKTLTLCIQRNENGEWVTAAEEDIPVTVVEKPAELALTGLMLGDSRIAGGGLLNAITAAMPDLELIGTRSRDDILHEGRGAWSTEHYLECRSSDVSGVDTTNAFFNPDTNCFDFAYYMNKYEQEHGSDPQALDFIVIHLGANDGWSRASVDNINTMIASIRAYSADIKIFVMTEYLSPADGYYLKGSRDVDSMRRRQFAYFTYMTEAFGDREDEQIYLLPNYISINDLSDWPTTTVTIDGKETVVVDDPQLVHLGEKGYAKEAATIEAWLYWLYGTTE